MWLAGLGSVLRMYINGARQRFATPGKPGAFVLFCEGTMVFSKIIWLEWMCLGILIAINAIASGANLVLKPQEEKKLSWES